MQQNSEVIQQWTESARYWEKHRDVLRQMFAPVTQALMEDAEIGEDDAALDLATGPGEPALSLVGRVGPKGRVVGLDAVPQMIEAARREAARRGLDNASFEVADVETLPFAGNSFDAVVSRFGVMFFPSPVNAIREALRVLKPGRKIAMAVWHHAARNPYHARVAEVVENYVASPPLPPDSPDAFRYAEPGKLLAVFSEAGVGSPSERLLQFPIQAPLTVEKFWALRYEMSDKLRTKLATLSPQQLQELEREVVDALGAYAADGGIEFPAEVLIVSGSKDPS